MGRVLGIVYRTIATHMIRKAGYTKTTAYAGAVTLIQRFGSALNLNIHYHMLFLDGGKFRWVKSPTSAELTQLEHTIANRIGRFLECQGLLEREIENSYLAADAVEMGSMEQLGGIPLPGASRSGHSRVARSSPLACDPEAQFGD